MHFINAQIKNNSCKTAFTIKHYKLPARATQMVATSASAATTAAPPAARDARATDFPVCRVPAPVTVLVWGAIEDIQYHK